MKVPFPCFLPFLFSTKVKVENHITSNQETQNKESCCLNKLHIYLTYSRQCTMFHQELQTCPDRLLCRSWSGKSTCHLGEGWVQWKKRWNTRQRSVEVPSAEMSSPWPERWPSSKSPMYFDLSCEDMLEILEIQESVSSTGKVSVPLPDFLFLTKSPS